MDFRTNWLRSVCIGVLAFGIVIIPLTASAQHKAKASTKRHKVTHKKSAHKRHVHRSTANRMHVNVVSSAPPQPAATAPAIPVVPTGPVAGKPYDENEWRGFHSDWNGQYFFNSGKYYYDQEYKYPAQIPNEFSSIASRFGGIDTLENDPTIVFSGDSGTLYPFSEYNTDRVKPEKKLKLKCAFFGRPYFWRDGVRYDRKTLVDEKDGRCFQFVKHG